MNGQPSFFKLAQREFWIVFGVTWLLLGTIFTGAGGYMAIQEWRYEENGATADGVVLELTSQPGQRSRHYYVRYRFRAGGKEFENREQVRWGTWTKLRVQGRVQVEFLADNPQSNRVLEEKDKVIVVVFPLLGLTFGGVGGFLFTKGLRRILLARRLYREGIPVEAHVDRVKVARRGKLERTTEYVICYSYRDHQGQTHKGESLHMPPGEVHGWKHGDTGEVRIDSQRPELSVWVGKPEAS